MAVNLSPFGPMPQFETASGVPAAGYRLFWYAAGTTNTKQNSYTTSTGLTASTNPVIMNSLGNPTNTQMWLTAGLGYKAVFAPIGDTDPPSSPIWTVDNIFGINDVTTTASQWIAGPPPTFVSATQFTVAGDQTSVFQVDRRVQAIVTAGTITGSITASVFAALTTVTVLWDSGALDSGLSAVSYGLLTPLTPSVPAIYAKKPEIQAQTYTAFTTGGTSSAYTGTLNPAIAAYAAPLRFFATLHTPPSGSPTIALNGLAAKNWKYVDQNRVKQFITASVTPTQTDNTYDGTDVVLLNPLRADLGNVQVSVRQAVQFGPLTAAGQADIIPQLYIGTSIATGVALKGSTAPFFASVGLGFNSDGSQKNINYLRSTDLAVINLSASATNYIFYDTATDTAGFVNIADAFQAGGTIPITNNQFTYDYLNHIMYIGNGSVATATARIIVAEVDTSATVVIAVRSRAYAGKYDSGFTATLTGAAGTYSKNHNMGTSEITVDEVIECTTNDNGYVVGDRIASPTLGFNGGATYPPVDNVGKNIVTRRFVSGASYTVPNGGTGAAANLTLASWKYKMTAARKF